MQNRRIRTSSTGYDLRNGYNAHGIGREASIGARRSASRRRPRQYRRPRRAGQPVSPRGLLARPAENRDQKEQKENTKNDTTKLLTAARPPVIRWYTDGPRRCPVSTKNRRGRTGGRGAAGRSSPGRRSARDHADEPLEIRPLGEAEGRRMVGGLRETPDDLRLASRVERRVGDDLLKELRAHEPGAREGEEHAARLEQLRRRGG